MNEAELRWGQCRVGQSSAGNKLVTHAARWNDGGFVYKQVEWPPAPLAPPREEQAVAPLHVRYGYTETTCNAATLDELTDTPRP